MSKFRRSLFALAVVALLSWPSSVPSEDGIERAGVAVGVTAGNMVFLPVKAASVVIGALSGALSFLVTGGDTEVTRQVWEDTARGPYVITREVASTAIGFRPEHGSTK